MLDFLGYRLERCVLERRTRHGDLVGLRSDLWLGYGKLDFRALRLGLGDSHVRLFHGG